MTVPYPTLQMPQPKLESLVREAGRLIMDFYAQAQVETRAKADASPVTAADLAAHRHLMAGLSAATPGIPVVSEESGDDEAAILKLIRASDDYWLVDPLDGTRDFLARTGDFTVNVAFIANGKVLVGCVFAPARGDLYIAAQGLGAEHVGPDGKRSRLRTRSPAYPPLRFLVSRHHKSNESDEVKRRYPGSSVTEMGSSLKYCVIAQGGADVALRRTPTMLWDTAAAQCVLGEAGGEIRDFHDAPLSYDGSTLVNPAFVAFGDRACLSSLRLDP